MSQVNLYKIQESSVEAFSNAIGGAYEHIGDHMHENFVMSLYFERATTAKDVSWKWVIDLFGGRTVQGGGQPKGVLIIKKIDSATEYAISFGGAYFSIDKYADRDFAFDFACKIGIS